MGQKWGYPCLLSVNKYIGEWNGSRIIVSANLPQTTDFIETVEMTTLLIPSGSEHFAVKCIALRSSVNEKKLLR